MEYQLHFALFLFFAIRIGLSDLAMLTIKNWDLFYFSLGILLLYGTNGSGALFHLLVTLVLFFISAISTGKIGAGDLKLLVVLTFLTENLLDWISALTVSLILAGAFAVFFLIKRHELRAKMPLAPFLFLGFSLWIK